MSSPISLARWVVNYIFQVTIAAVVGTLPPMIFFFLSALNSPDGSLFDVLKFTFIAGLACLMIVVLPFCLFVAAPVAIIIDRLIGLTRLRMLVLTLILVVPGVLLLDYQTYLSSGIDSGPPTEPYSLSHLVQSLSSPSDVFLMIALPTLSAFFASWVLWHSRFKSK